MKSKDQAIFIIFYIKKSSSLLAERHLGPNFKKQSVKLNHFAAFIDAYSYPKIRIIAEFSLAIQQIQC